MKDVRVGQNSPSESTLFLDILWWPKFISIIFYDQLKAPFQVGWVFDNSCIFWSFPGEKRPMNGRTCRNLHQCLAWIPTIGMSTYLIEKSWGHFKDVEK